MTPSRRRWTTPTKRRLGPLEADQVVRDVDAFVEAIFTGGYRLGSTSDESFGGTASAIQFWVGRKPADSCRCRPSSVEFSANLLTPSSLAPSRHCNNNRAPTPRRCRSGLTNMLMMYCETRRAL